MERGLPKPGRKLLRRLKEDLRDASGKRLFPDRHTHTVTFCLNNDEYTLYKSVTVYINEWWLAVPAMHDEECVQFLQWCLPLLRMRWRGFRKVRRQVCRRLAARLCELKIAGLSGYRAYLGSHPEEWPVLDSFCRITISRFYRDRHVFDLLARTLLPELGRRSLAGGCAALQTWSAGCGSGEEPYTLSLIWKEMVQPLLPEKLPLAILATDTNPHLLARASAGCYPAGSVKHLPEELARSAFEQPARRQFCLKNHYREGVTFAQADIRREMPDGPFDLILCRNLVFTYFDQDRQAELLDKMVERLRPGGFLVIGRREVLPGVRSSLQQHPQVNEIYYKINGLNDD